MNALAAAPPTLDPSHAAASAPSDATKESTLSASRPFPGLRPFGLADREFFFGRESQAFALYRLLEGGRFVAVVGSSGSGKSSLVLAGLLDLIDQETRDAQGPKWVWQVMRPGGSPIRRLAEALARLSPCEESEVGRARDRIETRLRQTSFSLESALKEAGGLDGRRLLLIVDQFEELFRFGLAGLGHRGTGVAGAKAREEATLFVQILLDARRVPNVNVLVTMRSDFIGDCAFFGGLPEAVSATQYLVPGLTRSQLEEVIRLPVEKAGASIEPELIERLLNDCGDELDQLPVLQHCMMRLWDRAGEQAAGAPRQLTRQTYEDIGRMTEALSRHADEVFRQCAGKELAVEQAFRALSELDREGRAVRRARRFSKLVAETGVPERDLRDVLDRFRAPTCSFLAPPLAAPLRDDDVVDIGHEALLRCWKTLAGDGSVKTSASPSGCPGWLAEERADGDRYRTLVGLIGGEKANLTAPEETKRWWDSRPRTSAWTERYGDRFDEVRELIRDSIEAQKRECEQARRTRRNQWAWTSLGIAGVAVAGAVFVGMLIRERQREVTQEALRLEEVDKSRILSAKTLLENVLGAYNDKSLDSAGAESLTTLAGRFLDDAHEARKTAAADLLWAQALNVDADLLTTLDKDDEALAQARMAKTTALALTEGRPRALEPLKALYDASIRVGNALAVQGRARRAEALEEYQFAIAVAEKIAASGDPDTGDNAAIDGRIKVGDVHRDADDRQRSESDYRAALAASEAALARRPGSSSLLRNEGKAFYRIADLLREADAIEQARAYYGKAADVQQALVLRDAQQALAAGKRPDLSLKSNLAATYTHWGLLERKANEPQLALAKLQQGVALNEELIKAQPSVLQWQDYVAPNYRYIAAILDDLNRRKEALDYYHKYYESRRTLAFRGLGPPEARRKLADAARLLGEHSTGIDQIDAYRTTVRVWSRLVDDPGTASAAADQYDVVMRIAAVFDAKNDWPDAQAAYRTASRMATLNLAANPTNAAWRGKVDAADKGAVSAGRAAENAPPAP